VKDLPAYDDMPEGKFESRITGLGPADRGAFEEFIQNVCKVNIALTSEPYWQSTGSAGGAADLLGDAAAPLITLLGTSNSSEEHKFNFAGFLRQNLGVDIYNAAVLGGGFGSSSFRYYASDEYRNQPPKVVVWEFLPQHNYNNAESLASLRQMIPAIYGACERTAALASYKGPIAGEKADVFDKLPGDKIRNAYLYLHLADPADRAFRIEILYGNGDADQVELTRSTRAANNGKYFLEIDRDNERILSAKIITAPGRGMLDALLCPYPTKVAEK
jgi:alginate biosynthesis protein AlgX